jgi:hypothetical protein
VNQAVLHRLANICKDYYVIRTIDNLFIYAGAQQDWCVAAEGNYNSDRIRKFYGWIQGITQHAPKKLDPIIVKVMQEIVENESVSDDERNAINQILQELTTEEQDQGIQLEPLMATLVRFLVKDGLTLEAGVLTASEAYFEWHSRDQLQGVDCYGLVFAVPLGVFTHIQAKVKGIQEAFLKRIQVITRAIPDEHIESVLIVPKMLKDTEWRSKAIAYLNGQDVNNQGRVRSDNIAPYTHKGLLFRSQPEINLFEALRALGVTFAPLPVFIRGGEDYHRIEPDFIIVKEGVFAVLEVDGDTFHKESPAEAQNRTMMLENEGARIFHVQASECDTLERATVCAKRILQTIAKLKVASR